jgi:2-amino-4-hydroxy-6-hydroxymethyldihydropteridine diphosphokinase
MVAPASPGASTGIIPRVQVLIGLGSNVGDPRAILATAVARLEERFALRAVSGAWHTAPLGPEQPDYLNGAVVIESGEDPLRLLAVCRRIEAQAGRDRRREERWGARRLDLDLLLIPGLVFASPDLTLPHPRLHERRFALLPACQVAAGWVHPRVHASLATLLARLDPLEQPCEGIGELVPANS